MCSCRPGHPFLFTSKILLRDECGIQPLLLDGGMSTSSNIGVGLRYQNHVTGALGDVGFPAASAHAIDSLDHSRPDTACFSPSLFVDKLADEAHEVDLRPLSGDTPLNLDEIQFQRIIKGIQDLH